jgi:hypothetical protein
MVNTKKRATYDTIWAFSLSLGFELFLTVGGLGERALTGRI